jgi:cathepsin L
MGWTGPVLDQGNCGTCWDVSGCDCITACFIKAGAAKNDGSFEIAAQYLLDQCGYQNAGCNGDDSINVLDWAKTNGIPCESDYGPYTAVQGRCKFKAGTKLYKLADWGFCTPSQQQGVAAVQDIKNAMVQHGPISSAVAADNSWDNPAADGSIPYRKLTPNDIDHDIQIVGWDDGKQIQGAPTKGAWLVKNQWNTTWGANGYCWIAYGSHQIGTEAAWGTVAALPPPPTPPTPTGVTITLSGPLPAGSYKVVPSSSIVIDPDMTLRDLLKTFNDAKVPALKP